MPKRQAESDEPVKLPDDPQAVLRALLAVDPDSEPVVDEPPSCALCGHSLSLHHLTPHGKQVGVTCQIEGCECHYEEDRPS